MNQFAFAMRAAAIFFALFISATLRVLAVEPADFENPPNSDTVWCAPWRVDITSAHKPGENRLEIEVANLWPNRLIGDAGLPPEQQRTRTNIRTFKKSDSLKPSGLIGPVNLLEEE